MTNLADRTPWLTTSFTKGDGRVEIRITFIRDNIRKAGQIKFRLQ